MLASASVADPPRGKDARRVVAGLSAEAWRENSGVCTLQSEVCNFALVQSVSSLAVCSDGSGASNASAL